jgi:hypothetical protein
VIKKLIIPPFQNQMNGFFWCGYHPKSDSDLFVSRRRQMKFLNNLYNRITEYGKNFITSNMLKSKSKKSESNNIIDDIKLLNDANCGYK